MLPEQFLLETVPKELSKAWSQHHDSGDILLVADDGDCLLGFASIWCGPSPYIHNLHVLPEKRSEGIGRSLLREVANQLILVDKSTVHLWVFE